MKHWSIKYRILFLAMFPVVAIAALLTILVMIGGITEMDGALKSRGMLILLCQIDFQTSSDVI